MPILVWVRNIFWCTRNGHHDDDDDKKKRQNEPKNDASDFRSFSLAQYYYYFSKNGSTRQTMPDQLNSVPINSYCCIFILLLLFSLL